MAINELNESKGIMWISHEIKYIKPNETIGIHPNDKDLICIRCGEILRKYRWNGRFLDVIEINKTIYCEKKI